MDVHILCFQEQSCSISIACLKIVFLPAFVTSSFVCKVNKWKNDVSTSDRMHRIKAIHPSFSLFYSGMVDMQPGESESPFVHHNRNHLKGFIIFTVTNTRCYRTHDLNNTTQGGLIK